MNRDRLEWHLENWRDYMQGDSSKLGAPTHSLVFVSGGTSTKDSFEIMCEKMDIANAREIDIIIDGLKPPQVVAIHHHWLQTKHCYPTQEMDYELGLEAIAKIADRRGII